MKSALFIKIPRVLLAFTVSVWMAGGCLFGCSNMQAMGAETVDSNATVVDGDSCEPAGGHSCCTKPKTKTSGRVKIVSARKDAPANPGATLTSAPRGMKDCPLMANTTAATSRNSGNVPEPGRTPVAVLPSIDSQFERAPVVITSSYRPNRGPTHLRCCVFLI